MKDFLGKNALNKPKSIGYNTVTKSMCVKTPVTYRLTKFGGHYSLKIIKIICGFFLLFFFCVFFFVLLFVFLSINSWSQYIMSETKKGLEHHTKYGIPVYTGQGAWMIKC
jgi:uncharacterized membrane protein